MFSKVQAWLGGSRLTFEESTSYTSYNSCILNNYQTINPIIIPYGFGHKY
jgi:hypothetical protein